jgi:hypothetical protein
MTVLRYLRLVILGLVALTVVGCAAAPVEEEMLDGDETELIATDDAALGRQFTIEQGWDQGQRDAFHYTTQGSSIVPAPWFLALEQAGSKQLFSARANMRALGFTYGVSTPLNPDRLPIGLTREHPDDPASALGITCAGCHTGTFTYEGQTAQVEAGQGFINFGRFVTALAGSAAETVKDDRKFARFAARVRKATGQDNAALRAELQAFVDEFSLFASQSAGSRDFGFGRLDTSNVVLNAIICRSFNMTSNCQDAVLPSVMPHVWNSDKVEWVQTNGNQHIPVVRDWLQALAFAKMKRHEDGSVTHTVNTGNLRRIEHLITELTPPAWPEKLFGKINPTLAERGAELYASNCQSCHSLAPHTMSPPNAFGKSFIQVTMVPAADVGTDPAFAKGYLGRRANAGVYAPGFKAEDFGPDGKVVAVALTRNVFLPLLGAELATKTDAEKVAFLDYRESKAPSVAQLLSYRAAPLAGIALSGYFLHNGAVRTMYQLLLPPDQRETEFYVGSREYDPVQMGYVSDASYPGAYTFKTGPAGAPGVPSGDSNQGHAYGTDLDDADRYALIEFIKTL